MARPGCLPVELRTENLNTSDASNSATENVIVVMGIRRSLDSLKNDWPEVRAVYQNLDIQFRLNVTMWVEYQMSVYRAIWIVSQLPRRAMNWEEMEFLSHYGPSLLAAKHPFLNQSCAWPSLSAKLEEMTSSRFLERTASSLFLNIAIALKLPNQPPLTDPEYDLVMSPADTHGLLNSINYTELGYYKENLFIHFHAAIRFMKLDKCAGLPDPYKAIQFLPREGMEVFVRGRRADVFHNIKCLELHAESSFQPFGANWNAWEAQYIQYLAGSLCNQSWRAQFIDITLEEPPVPGAQLNVVFTAAGPIIRDAQDDWELCRIRGHGSISENPSLLFPVEYFPCPRVQLDGEVDTRGAKHGHVTLNLFFRAPNGEKVYIYCALTPFGIFGTFEIDGTVMGNVYFWKEDWIADEIQD